MQLPDLTDNYRNEAHLLMIVYGIHEGKKL